MYGLLDVQENNAFEELTSFKNQKLDDLIFLIRERGVIFRKFSNYSEIKLSNFFEKLKFKTQTSKKPIVPIDINFGIIEGLIGSDRSDWYNYKVSKKAYAHLFNSMIEAMGNGPLKETKNYKTLVKIANLNFKNIYHNHLSFGKGVIKNAPLFSQGLNIGVNLRRIYFAMSKPEELDQNQIYTHLDYRFEKNQLEIGPRIIFNLVGFPIIKELDYNSWDKQVKAVDNKKETSLSLKGDNDKLIKIVTYINSFLDDLMHGGLGIARTVAYPGWITELANNRPFDSKKMGFGLQEADLKIGYGNTRDSTQGYLNRMPNYKI